MAIDQRNGERWSQKRRPYMGITIFITPFGIMAIGNPGWRKVFNGSFQIPDNAAFKFDGCDRSGRARHKDIQRSGGTLALDGGAQQLFELLISMFCFFWR